MATAELRAKISADHSQWSRAVAGVKGDVAALGQATSAYGRTATQAHAKSIAAAQGISVMAGAGGPAGTVISALGRSLLETNGNMAAFASTLANVAPWVIAIASVGKLLKDIRALSAEYRKLSAEVDKLGASGLGLKINLASQIVEKYMPGAGGLTMNAATQSEEDKARAARTAAQRAMLAERAKEKGPVETVLSQMTDAEVNAKNAAAEFDRRLAAENKRREQDAQYKREAEERDRRREQEQQRYFGLGVSASDAARERITRAQIEANVRGGMGADATATAVPSPKVAPAGRLPAEPAPVTFPPIREAKPTGEQLDFFKSRRDVAGMATEEGTVLVNPYGTATQGEARQSILLNEASRVHMEQTGYAPKFDLTAEQRKEFADYSDNLLDIKRTILARVIAGDESAGSATRAQQVEADAMRPVVQARLASRPTTVPARPVATGALPSPAETLTSSISAIDRRMAESPAAALAELERLGGGAGQAERGAVVMETLAKVREQLGKEEKDREDLIAGAQEDLAKATDAIAKELERQANEERLRKFDDRVEKAREQLANVLDAEAMRVEGLGAVGAGDSILDEQRLAGMKPSERRAYRKQIKEDQELAEKLDKLRAGERVHLTKRERARIDEMARAEMVGGKNAAQAQAQLKQVEADRQAAMRAAQEADNAANLAELTRRAGDLRLILEELRAMQPGLQ